MSDAQETHDPLQHVEDPGEYNQRLRLQEISQARKNARLALGAEAKQAYGNDWPEVALLEVQSLAAELEWLIKEQGDKEYLTKELGPITMDPPTKEEMSAEHIIGAPPEPKKIPVKGLYTTKRTGTGFVDLPVIISRTWKVKVEVRHKAPDRDKFTKHRRVPPSVTKEANSLCRKFINEAGLDARLEDERPFTEY